MNERMKPYFSDQQVDLLKKTSCAGFSEDELQLFIQACEKTNLDPFMRQIYGVKVWNNQLKKHVLTIQTGIDGYRLIADRTGKYSPGESCEYIYDSEGKLIAAKAFIKKMTPDGTWHTISSDAFMEEYAQRNKDGNLNSFWRTKGHVMLAKCAEALALRKAFPSELSGIYTKEEMDQAMNEAPVEVVIEMINENQVEELQSGLDILGKDRTERFFKAFKIAKLEDIKQQDFPAIRNSIKKALEKEVKNEQA